MDYSQEVLDKHRKAFGEWVEQQQNQIIPRPTDRKLAKMIGMSATQLGNVKRGMTGITASTAVKIANAFRRPANEVLELAGHPVDKDYEPDLRLARRLHAVLGDIPETERQKAELILETMAISIRPLLIASMQ